MAKYRVGIRLVEHYSNAACVEADSPEEAERKIREEMDEYDYLYTMVTDYIDSQELSVECEGIVKDEEEESELIEVV